MEKTKKAGAPVRHQTNQFVQTDKASHEAWSRLAIKDPKASALLHLLVSHMNQGRDPVVVVPQGLLGKMLGCSVRTVSRAVKRLIDENWIEAVKLGPGTVSAYRINSRAAWTAPRNDLKWSKFNSLIIADYADQTNLKDTELRKIPSMVDGEIQILTGDGEEPPSQPILDGVDSGLPTLSEKDEHDDQGQKRLSD